MWVIILNLMDRLNTSYRYVCDNSEYVKINYTKIDDLIKKIKSSSSKHWLDSNPYRLMDMSVEDIINFLLIYHTIGDYCFWSEPKWQIQTSQGIMDGSFAIMYLIINRFKTNKNFEMAFEEFKQLLKGNVTIPLLEDRYKNLVKMNQFLKKQRKTFYELTKDLNTDSQLLEYILRNLDYFEDTSNYNAKEILFYKRAQLLTSDILHIKEKLENKNVDYSHLIGCADYKIPQVMRCYGMLEFSNELSNRVDKKIELQESSKEEIEIRANTLKVIDYIYEKLDGKYSHMAINDFIWLLGQDKSQMTLPYHRTLTNHY